MTGSQLNKKQNKTKSSKLYQRSNSVEIGFLRPLKKLHIDFEIHENANYHSHEYIKSDKFWVILMIVTDEN